MTTTETNKQFGDDRKTGGSDAGELLSAATGKAKQTLEGVRARLGSAFHSTRAAAQRAQSNAVATVKATDRCVRSHPYQTIAVFFGLGLVTGVLLARK